MWHDEHVLGGLGHVGFVVAQILWYWLVGEAHWIGGVNVMGCVTGVGCNSVRGDFSLGDWTYSNIYLIILIYVALHIF